MIKLKLLLLILVAIFSCSCGQKREKRSLQELQNEFNTQGIPKRNWDLKGSPKSLKVYKVEEDSGVSKLEWEGGFNEKGQLIYKRDFTFSTSYANPSYETEYTYNVNGCLQLVWSKEKDVIRTNRIEYDKGRPHKEYIENSNWVFKQVVEYSYDDFNYLAAEQVVDYNGKQKSNIYETKYKYDFKNRRISIKRTIDNVFDYENIYKYSDWDWPIEEIKIDKSGKRKIKYKIENKSDGYLVKSDSTVTFYNLKKQCVREEAFKGDVTLSSYDAKFNPVSGLLESEKSYNGSYTSEDFYTYDKFNNWIRHKSVINMEGKTPGIFLYVRKIEYY